MLLSFTRLKQNGLAAQAVGSVSVSLIRTISRPLMVVKESAALAVVADTDAEKLSCMVQVGGTHALLMASHSAWLMASLGSKIVVRKSTAPE